MAELTFGCTGAHVVRYAATPTFGLSLNITESTGVRLHAVALRCQIRIEPQRRPYTADEARRLSDLFGDSARLAEAPEPLQLATLSTLVPGFTARTELELKVPCSYDLEVASARYLQALDDGIIPLLLLFSGTVFVDHGHTYGVELIPWSLEVPFRMPVRVWHDVIEEHFPGSAWLRCSRETLDALAEFKSACRLPTWDATLSALLGAASAPWDPGVHQEPGTAAPEPQDTAEDPEAVPPEAQDTAPEPAANPEPANAATEPETESPETESPEAADAAPGETAAEESALEPAAATAEPRDPPPESPDSPPAPGEAAPVEQAAEERHAGTGRRRTGTAGRRTAARRATGRRAGEASAGETS
jgi:hypothetical protein